VQDLWCYVGSMGKACDSAELEGMQFSLYHFAHRDIIGVLTAWFCERAIVVK
jgi:hypothetical protein